MTDETHDEKAHMSFMDHLMELRARLLWSILAVAIGLAVSAIFVSPIIDVLRVPMERFREAHPEAPKVFRSPPMTAGFSAVISVCVFGGLALAMPFVLYQLWLFVRPALKKGERAAVVPLVAFGTGLFLGGATVAYLFVTDAALNFLFAMNRLVGSEQTCGVGEYLRFVVTLMLGFGVGFQLPLVMLDPSRIERVFINLIMNAAEAMDGEGLLTLKTRKGRTGDYVVITISDTGPGISPANLNRIFDPFFTTKEVGRGTGLGLAISYGIIKDHGGTISVASRTGECTTFVVRLPVQEGVKVPGGIEVPEKVKELLTKADNKLVSMGYLYGGPENDGRFLDTYYIKGDKIKVKLYEDNIYVEDGYFDTVYLNTVEKTAIGRCENQKRCVSSRVDNMNKDFDATYDDYRRKTPYEWLQDITTPAAIGEEVVDKRSALKIEYPKKETKTSYYGNNGVSACFSCISSLCLCFIPLCHNRRVKSNKNVNSKRYRRGENR